MSARRKTAGHGPLWGMGAKPHRSRPTDRITRRWRRNTRSEAVQSASSATHGLRWNKRLVEAILEEFYVDDDLERLLGHTIDDLRPREYARAVAIGLILRHSWHPDDLAWILERLSLGVDRRKRNTRSIARRVR